MNTMIRYAKQTVLLVAILAGATLNSIALAGKVTDIHALNINATDDDGDGTEGETTETTYVCQNKGTAVKYETLAEGFASCQEATTDDEKTIVLLEDVTASSTTAQYNFILDLNNHTITGNVVINTTSTDPCIITDNSEEGNGTITNTTASAVSITKGSLEINKGTFSSSAETLKNSGGTCVINGGTFTASSYDAVVNTSSGKMTINDGIFTAGQYDAVYNNAYSNLTINGGTFTGKGSAYAVYNTHQNDIVRLKIYGGTFKSNNSCDIFTTRLVEIYGGNFTGKSHANIVYDGGNGLAFKVYGGSYRIFDNNIHCGIQDPDKTLGIVNGHYELVDRDVMCNINGTEYRSIESAIKAAQQGDVITVTRDVDDGHGIELSDVTKGMDIIIDFGGHIYQAMTKPVGSSTTISQVLHYGNDNTLTVKNGTIKIKDGSNYFLMFMQNYSNLTIENMNIDATNVNNASKCFNFNNGASTIKGNTTITFASTTDNRPNITLNMGGGSNYKDGASLIIDGNEVTINGSFEVQNFEGKNAGLSINGGYFSDFYIKETVNKDNVKISGGTYAINDDFITADRKIDDYCIEEYCACDHREAKGDRPETWTVRWPVPELDSNGGYAGYGRTEDKDVTSAYYTRSFSKNVTDHYQCWFVPFDYEVTEDDAEDYDFYSINAASGLGDATIISISKLNIGDNLSANTPFVVKPKKIETHGFASPYAKTLKAKNDDCIVTLTAGGNDFNFYGIYERTYATANDEWLTISVSGTSFWSRKGNDVKPFRWIIKATDAETGAPSKVYFSFAETENPGEEETTGVTEATIGTDNNIVESVYTVDGRKTDRLQKGINILKMKDGSTRKVFCRGDF